jgi:hypothetical protein
MCTGCHRRSLDRAGSGFSDAEQIVREVIECWCARVRAEIRCGTRSVGCSRRARAQPHFFHEPRCRNDLRRLPECERGATADPSYGVTLRARNRAASGRGQEQQAGRLGFAFKRENNRDTPLEHHAQIGHPLHERVGSLCRSQPCCSGSGWPTMT